MLFKFLQPINTKPTDMSDTDKQGYIGLNIEEATKKQFAKLCKEKESNMSVEIKRFIYNELAKAGK